jgi:hypothetical protein
VTDRVKLALSAPITAHGNQVSELSFRPMTGKDLRICGFPVKGDSIDAAVVHRLIATLAEVPPSSIDELSAADWTAAFNVVQDFLVAPTSGR